MRWFPETVGARAAIVIVATIVWCVLMWFVAQNARAQAAPCPPDPFVLVHKIVAIAESISDLPDDPVDGGRWVVQGDTGVWEWGIMGWTRGGPVRALIARLTGRVLRCSTTGGVLPAPSVMNSVVSEAARHLA